MFFKSKYTFLLLFVVLFIGITNQAFAMERGKISTLESILHSKVEHDFMSCKRTMQQNVQQVSKKQLVPAWCKSWWASLSEEERNASDMVTDAR